MREYADSEKDWNVMLWRVRACACEQLVCVNREGNKFDGEDEDDDDDDDERVSGEGGS